MYNLRYLKQAPFNSPASVLIITYCFINASQTIVYIKNSRLLKGTQNKYLKSSVLQIRYLKRVPFNSIIRDTNINKRY